MEQLDAYIQAHAANKRFNGSVLIAKGDTVLFERSYGLASRAFDVPIAPTTRFLIGSITKPFTALGILLLEQQGKLKLDDKLATYFPNFPNADRITLKQLLNHTSGITDYHAFANWEERGRMSVTPGSTLATLLERPSLFEPGTRFSYSNSGYLFLGLIIEQVSGRSFEAFIREEILDPLKLEHTGIASNTRIIPELAIGYTSSPRETQHASYINYDQPFASGNMYSTPRDLWAFTQAVVQSKLLPEATTKELFQSTWSYGYGWGIRDYDGIRTYGHFGGMNGYVGGISYIPEADYFICFLTNDDNTPKHTLMEDLIRIVHGREVLPPKPVQTIGLTDRMKSTVLGDYLVKPGDTLHVFEQDDRLFLRETGQMRHELFPIDTLEFAFTLLEFTAAFSKPGTQGSDSLRFTGKSGLLGRRIR